MYSVSTKVKLHYTDAAGVMFFGNYFKLIHDAYEDFLDSCGFNLGDVIDKSDYLILIVHSEADYRQPVRAGQSVNINMAVDKIKNSSFVLNYVITNEKEKKIANLQTVHVAIDKSNGKKISLPAELRIQLERHVG
ncbi:MAG: thioesterase family protein [candidate division Zixibacteria bacterium]|nr:thioesterase family protein [candidate division Zixibacteria bacterium]